MTASESALLAWRTDPFLVFALVAAAGVYLRGWSVLRAQVPSRFPVWRLWCFLGGLLFLFVAVASPLDAFAGFLLQVHMIQHLLLTMLIPPLLLLGTPWLPMLRGLPRAWVREVVAPFLNGPCWKTCAGFLAHPVTAWVLFVSSNVLWHIPVFYDAALRSDFWHAVEHGCFLGTALLFWWHVVLPWPAHPKWTRWMAIPYLLLADLQNTALAAFLTFFDKPLYPAYQSVPRLWGQTVMNDQATAGLIMWVPGSLAFILPAVAIAVQLLSPRQAIRPGGWERKPARLAGNLGSWFVRLARSPARRGVQWFLLLLALIVIADGFLGPSVAAMNLAGVLPWTYWRGFGVIALLAVGNLLCAGCPFVLARDIARKIVPGKPGWLWPRALRNKWSAVALLAIFLWTYEAFGLWQRPMATAGVIVAYFALAIVIDWLFRGASFCKYVCPIGQYHFVFSGSSPSEIAVANPAVCGTCKTHDCLRGNAADRGCETYLLQPSKSGNMDCTFCLDCVRACPHDNVALAAVVPTRDLASDRFRSAIGRYSQRPDLAALLGIFVAGAFANAAAMTAPVASAIAANGPPHWLAVSVFMLSNLLVLPLTVGYGTATASRLLGAGKDSVSRTLVRFASALVPLGASVWAAHFLFHLATGAFTIVPVTQRVLHDLGFSTTPDWSIVGFSGDWITSLQIALLDLGYLASLYVAWKIAGDVFENGNRFRGFLPWCVLATWLFAIAVWLVFQPMDMRGTMR